MALAPASAGLVTPSPLVTSRRFDLAVKWRLFSHLRHGGDEDAFRVYCWMIEARSGARMQAGLATDKWKRSIRDYLTSAALLCQSMQDGGFDSSKPIPIDPAGELLDGSHRLACALALNLSEIPISRRDQAVWAPAWGEAWFVDNGMSVSDLQRLRQDWEALR